MRSWLMGAVGVAAACVAGPPDTEEDRPEIVRGSDEAGFPGVLELVTPTGPCTATLVAPRVALTVKHCVQYPGSSNSAVGLELRSGPKAEVSAARVIDERGPPGLAWADDAADFLALVLDRAPDLATVPLRLEPLDATVVGREALMVGYGATRARDTASKGTKRSGWTTIVGLEESPPVLRTAGGPNVPLGCFGDSGGPLLLDGTLVGVYVAFDDMSRACATGGRYLRVSAVASYITEAMALGSAGPAPDPCPQCVDIGLCPVEYCVEGDAGAYCDEATRCRDDLGVEHTCAADADCWI